MDRFVHLEVQSAFSFLWGTFTPEALVQKVVNLGQRAVALTDFGLHGAVEFYKAATTAGIQPIIGARVSIWDCSHITLLATDLDAYGNLCRLVSIVLDDSMAPKIQLTRQDLKHWSRGLICLAGGRGSKIRSFVEKGNKEAARTSLLELRGALHDPDSLYVVLQNHGILGHATPAPPQEMTAALEKTIDLATSIDLPVVATNGAAFLKPEDYIVHHTLIGIQRSHHHRNIDPLPNNQFFLASTEEMKRRIPYPQALTNTARIAGLCRSFSLPVGRLHPPSLQEPRKAAGTLTTLCMKELARHFQPVQAGYLRQLSLELKCIKKLELADFFLLVREVVKFARSQQIRHSVRGSAAGSLVVYLLLGGVDPVAHNLLFERFINEGRGDMPDIDLDFDSKRRDEVIRYLLDRFPLRTAMVCTILKFKVRSAVRLAARALGYPLKEIKRLSTCLPWSLRGRDLHEALGKLPELQDSPLHTETELVDLAARLTGIPCQCSVHLGGVIIVPENIKAWTPVGLSPQGLPVGQLDKDDVDDLGLLKLDILGLRMHTAIRRSLEFLQEKGIAPDLERMPLDDRKTYALLRSTESLGVFQLESPGQRNLLGRLQPNRFSDLISEISLFRPGPVGGDMVDVYVRRRLGEEKVSVPHPDLNPILEETYGVILFQEHVLRIVHFFAGLSYADADAFRRAMTKDRKTRRMKLLEESFFKGALAKGYPREVIEKVFEQVASFASFGFCKAHAASFAHITYQSAYFKTHYPQAFYLGLLNAGHVGSYPPYAILNEARRRGIAIFAPHVNAGGLEYHAEGSGIRAPLVVINDVGAATARRIVADRTKRGPFRSLQDFLSRMPLPERIIEKLSLAGALKGLDEQKWELTQQEVCNG